MCLVDNAIKFTKKGSVSIAIDELPTKMPSDSSDKATIELQFVIRDTGIGIAVEQLNNIFDHFSQAHQSINRKYGGTGLGLSIVKKLVNLQNGNISVTSALNEGTAFYIKLPFSKTDKVVNVPKRDFPIQNIIQQLKNIRVLLVEDNVFNQVLTIDTLKLYLENVHIDIANNGVEAIQQISAITELYDIILMDIQMPKMDGYRATAEIRKNPDERKRETPIIALTASAFLTEKEKAKLSYATHNQQTAPPIVDLSFLEKFTKGNKTKLNKYIDLFLQTAPKQLSALQQHLAEKNWKAVRSNAHTLKSQLRYMGIHSLSLTINAVEQSAAKEVALDQIPAWVQEIREVCEQAFVELRKER